MRIINANRSSRVDEENPYWISFSDLMSGLLVLFILASLALIIQLTQTQQRIDEDIEQLKNADKVRTNILYEVKNQLEKQNIEVEVVDNDTVLRIPENTLAFASDKDYIPWDVNVRKQVKAIGSILHEALIKVSESDKDYLRLDYLDTVFIEGHTDSQNTKREKGNWGLSTFRAISLWDFWETNLDLDPPLSEMRNSNGYKLFSVSGYAATRRVNKEEQTKEQRRENRRIDIRFTVKRPRIEELEAIVNQ